MTNSSFSISVLVQRQHIGCFKDTLTRAMPVKFGNGIDLLQSCTQIALMKNYTVFGIQFGECFSGPTAQHTYDKYGTSTACVDGVGGPWANDVYRIHFITAGNLDFKETCIMGSNSYRDYATQTM